VRETQIRLILQPIIDNLLYLLGDRENIKKQFNQILDKLRQKSPQETGYTGGNALNLMIHLPIELSGLDFSHLTVWQAYLPDVNLHEVNFAHSDLSKSVFAETLDSIMSVAFSPDGKMLATGDGNGEIRLWQVADGKQLFSCKSHTDLIKSVAFSPIPLMSPIPLIPKEGLMSLPYQGGLGGLLASGGRDEIIKIWDIQTGECLKTLKIDRPYQNMNITAIKGVTQATISTLKALGAIDTKTP